ncbi:MAG: S1 RNA-binding domain-containing protein [Armatimonadota bacterium]
MSLDIGSIADGTVVKLAEYGVIVRLEGGKTGLVHISEIADTFVRDVHDYFKEQDRVRVKVLSLNPKGRYELSTKNIEQPERIAPSPRPKPARRPPEPVYLGPEASGSGGSEFHSSFEDRMSQFMKDSQERLLDIKRNMDFKQGARRR